MWKSIQDMKIQFNQKKRIVKIQIEMTLEMKNLVSKINIPLETITERMGHVEGTVWA